MYGDIAAVRLQVTDLVKEVCRTLKKNDSAGMPDTYLAAMQKAFQRHLPDDQSRQSMQDFITMCTRVAQMYAGFNASATALLHIAKVHTPATASSALGLLESSSNRLDNASHASTISKDIGKLLPHYILLS